MTADTESERANPQVAVVAHRGASRAFPENTLAAFEGAARLGADGVELDVRRTADRQLVVHHDPAVAGTSQPIVEQRRDELPDSVCSLADALAVCKRSSPPLAVNIEIKSDRDEPDYDPEYWICDAVIEAVEAGLGELLSRDRVLVSSFDVRAIDRVRAHELRMPTGLLSARLDDAFKVVKLVSVRGHVALNPWDPFVTPALVGAAHDAGLAVNVWTVDDPDRMRELVDFGVDGIITNVPDVARAVLDSASGS
ncbi:MAG: glycerophosphodiester phosphodiesterase [Actinobacteria bacterium]|nr:glycerophosphodiester phosphodiesterase [Actinomycetota bacterium]